MDRHDHLHFDDYLNRLPGSLVYERFVKRCGLGRKIVSASTIKDVGARFAAEKNLKEIFFRLSKDARYYLGLAYLSGDRGLPFEIVHPSAGKSGPKTEGEGFDAKKTEAAWFEDELLGSFLVYAAKDAQGNRYYVGFDEFEPLLRNLLAESIVGKIRTPLQKEAHFSSPDLCVSDVTAIVALASQGKLTKTKTGHLSKVSEQLVNRLLHGAQGAFDSGPGFARPALLAIEYTLRKGLISLHDEQFVAHHDRMAAWVSRPMSELSSDFAAFAFSSWPLWRKGMVHEMLSSADNPWLSASAFGAEMKNRATATIKLMAYLGLVEYCKSAGDYLFRGPRRSVPGRVAASGGRQTQSPGVVMLPDFSAMLAQEIAPEDLYWFSKVGSLDSFDKVYRGKISKDILCDSLSAEIEGKKIMELLTRWHSTANVIETVKEWIREFSRVFMETGAIVVSSEEKVTKQLCSYGPLAGSLTPLTAHCIFKVAKGKEASVAAILAEMGFDPRSPLLQHPHGALERPFETGSVHGLHKEEPQLSPVFDFEEEDGAPGRNPHQGKYSSQLKALELTELIHVVDFSLLMGCNLRIEYSGSPGVRKGMYLVRPLQYQKSPNPILEGETGRASVKKIFLLERIAMIGVESDHE
jgi:hypothetical protein